MLIIRDGNADRSDPFRPASHLARKNAG